MQNKLIYPFLEQLATGSTRGTRVFYSAQPLPSSTFFRNALLLFSGSLFLASLTQPAFYLDQANRDAWADSWYLLLFGWTGFLAGSAESLLWLANPLYLCSLGLFANGKRLAQWTASGAALLAACFSAVDTIVANEAGHSTRVSSLEAGYYLWATSMALLAVGCLGYYYLHNRQVREQTVS